MIKIKTDKELEIMEKSGQILASVMWELVDFIKPGVSEIEIDQLAEKLIRQKGGEPGFMKVAGYRHTICISVNDVVVHGIPTNNKLKAGDIVGIDCGVFYQGFHSDMSETVYLKSQKLNLKSQKLDEIDKFLEVGKNALNLAIDQAKVGNHVGDVSKTIQSVVEPHGYSIVRTLVGHGVGKLLHEEPEVPGYLVGEIKNTPSFKAGMVIAIEVIYNMGSPELALDRDGWTLRTKDGSLGGLFERTVAITKNGPQILTP